MLAQYSGRKALYQDPSSACDMAESPLHMKLSVLNRGNIEECPGGYPTWEWRPANVVKPVK